MPKLILFILVALSGSSFSYGEVLSTSHRFQNLTEFFTNEVQSGKIPGAVILIQQGGRPIYARAFGVRNPVTGAPMTADSIFALKSMTKPITSLGALMLADAGKISLDDPLAKYIPEFADTKVGIETADPDGNPLLKLEPPVRAVTIKDLMRHTSGITYGYIGGNLIKKAYENGNIFQGAYDNETLAKRIAQLPLSRHPGTLWRYGHSTDVLGRVIEVASGKSLYEFLKQQIFDPLQMTDTKFTLTVESERQRMAEPFPNDVILNLSEQERRAHPEYESGGGGLVSTIGDYAKFAQIILDQAHGRGPKFLSPEMFTAMTTDQIGVGTGVGRDYFYFPGDGFGFGLGFAVRIEPGTTVPPPPGPLGELKWDSGAGTYVGIVPEMDMFYILLMQTQPERGRILPVFRKLVFENF